MLNLTAPAADAGVTTTTVEVSGTATDDAAPPTVEVSLDGTTWAAVTLASSGTFTTQVALPLVDGNDLLLTVRARDSKAHEVRESRSLRVDNVAPGCAFTSPIAGAVLSGTSVAVAMTASDGSGLVNPRLSLDSAATFAAPLGSGGSYTFAWSPANENGIAHELVFRVDDTHGKTCEARRTVTIDNVAPTVAFASPDAGALLGPAFFASGRFAGTAGDGTRALKSLTLDFADGQGPRAVTAQDGGWSLAVPQVATDDYQAHAVKVVATDLADNTATVTLPVFADVVAPALAITAPAANAKLNAASFSGTDDVALAWTVTDGDPTAPTVALQTADGGTLTPPKVTTTPNDNPATYQPTLVATDRAGNSRTATVTFSVDRVVPTVTATAPANETRMFTGKATIDFSESIMGGDGLTLTPTLTGVWTTPSHYEVSGLTKDTVFNAVTGAVSDLYGNPVVAGGPYRFHTETWVPTAGATIATGFTNVLEAVADQEGALNLIAVRTDGVHVWVQFNPSTGTPTAFLPQSIGTDPQRVAAWTTVQSDLSSRRIAGVTVIGSPNIVRYRVNQVSQQGFNSADFFIPTPPFVGEGAGLDEVGVIAGASYRRGGRADLALGFVPTTLRTSAKHWEVARPNLDGADAQTFGCYHQLFDICDLSGVVTTIGGVSSGETLEAISSSCSVHLVSEVFSSTTFSKWQPGCTSSCAANSSATIGAGQIVSDPNMDGVFYALPVFSMPFQLKKIALSSSCAGTWSNFGAPITIPNLGSGPRLVVIRGSPGLVYADTSGNVKFVGP